MAIAGVYVAVLFAPFLAPNSPNQQNRDVPAAPPTRIYFVLESWSIPRPVVYRQIEKPIATGIYHEDRSIAFPVRFFTSGEPYTFAGLTFTTRLFGVESPASL